LNQPSASEFAINSAFDEWFVSGDENQQIIIPIHLLITLLDAIASVFMV